MKKSILVVACVLLFCGCLCQAPEKQVAPTVPQDTIPPDESVALFDSGQAIACTYVDSGFPARLYAKDQRVRYEIDFLGDTIVYLMANDTEENYTYIQVPLVSEAWVELVNESEKKVKIQDVRQGLVNMDCQVAELNDSMFEIPEDARIAASFEELVGGSQQDFMGLIPGQPNITT